MVSGIGARPRLDEPPSSRGNGPQDMGKDDFLKLLIAKLRQQDPLKPSEDQEFIAQIAQFNSLSEMQQMNKNFAAFRLTNEMSQGSTLLGREVTAVVRAGQLASGVVSEVRVVDGTVHLRAGTHWITLDQITTIRPGAAAPNAPTTPASGELS